MTLTMTRWAEAGTQGPAFAGSSPVTLGLDALSTAVVALSRDREVVYVNPAAENLFKISHRHVLGMAMAETFPEAPELDGLLNQVSAAASSFHRARSGHPVHRSGPCRGFLHRLAAGCRRFLRLRAGVCRTAPATAHGAR